MHLPDHAAWPRRRGDRMRRRQFMTLIGGAAAVWPLAARAQQGSAMPRVGALFGIAENDPEGRNRIDAFRQGLEKLGWVQGKTFTSRHVGPVVIPSG
jgi:hypothetical protein